MGAIAAHGGRDGLVLFRSVLLASTALPGAFPPVLIDVEANGKRFAELHVDGGIGGQFFVAPGPLLLPTSDFRLPATQLYIVSTPGSNGTFRSSTVFVPDDPYPGSRCRRKDRHAIDARHRLHRRQTQWRRFQCRRYSRQASTHQARVRLIPVTWGRCSRPATIKAKARHLSATNPRPIQAGHRRSRVRMRNLE